MSTTVYTNNGQVLIDVSDNKWLAESSGPAPQEIIIPTCWTITSETPYSVYVTDVPLNTNITYSYDSYNGAGIPDHIDISYYTTLWESIDGPSNIQIIDNKATWSISEFPSYHGNPVYIMIINVAPTNIYDPYLIPTDFTGLKLYYMG